MLEQREAGVLLPIFSLPGPYGIGTLGREARQFVDFLVRAGQRCWQILPLVPPGEANSPYMSPSAFGGNPLLIDLEDLEQLGLLTAEELAQARWDSPDRVDYDHLWANRIPLLRRAFARSAPQPAPWPWLADYAAFMALHDHYAAPWWAWPKATVSPSQEDVDFHIFLQITFFRQWQGLKAYANARGVSFLGDIPIYVSGDSVEVYSHPQLFQLDEHLAPTSVAGVPPDAFSQTGQLWGNPLYRWTDQKEALFAWWGERMTWAATLYDGVRIDHFRGFHTYWSVPAHAQDARSGHWELGPGQALVDYLTAAVPSLAYIAEDLGDLDAQALAFLRNSGLPGMKVLLYAFDPQGDSAYLPHNAIPCSVMYTGTHDTPTFLQWLFHEADDAQRRFATEYLRLREDEGFGWGAIAGAWASTSALAITPFQDILGLGGDARMNHPGTMGRENWSWRVRQEAINPELADRLRHLTHTYRRC